MNCMLPLGLYPYKTDDVLRAPFNSSIYTEMIKANACLLFGRKSLVRNPKKESFYRKLPIGLDLNEERKQSTLHTTGS
jgi:hypothetical protein